MIFLITPPAGAVIGFITFIASTISKVSPALTASPTATNGAADGSGDRNAVPTIGDLIVSPEISSGTAAGVVAAGAEIGAAAGVGAGAMPSARLTLMRRSPSATSISVSAFSVKSSA